MASATTDFPLPSTQLTAAGFLSVQKFPERDYLHVGEDVQHSVDGKLGCLAQHVHSHGVSRTRHKPDVKLSTSHPCVDSLQPGKPAGRVKMMLD